MRALTLNALLLLLICTSACTQHDRNWEANYSGMAVGDSFVDITLDR